MQIVVGEYCGVAMSEIDFEIYQRRLSSNCTVMPQTIYHREDGKMHPSEVCCVIDYHDGEYVNFRQIKGVCDIWE